MSGRRETQPLRLVTRNRRYVKVLCIAKIIHPRETRTPPAGLNGWR